MSSILTGIRAELAAALEAAGINVRDSASSGHMSPPAAIVTPGPEWIVANAQLGGTLHARVTGLGDRSRLWRRPALAEALNGVQSRPRGSVIR